MNHLIAITIPIGGDDRQARCHRLSDRQTKGLLKVIGKRSAKISRLPDRKAMIGFGAVDERDANARREYCGARSEGLRDALVRRPSEKHEMHLFARGLRRL